MHSKNYLDHHIKKIKQNLGKILHSNQSTYRKLSIKLLTEELSGYFERENHFQNGPKAEF